MWGLHLNQVALLDVLAEGGALHLLPSSKAFPDSLQACFKVKTASFQVVQAYVQLLVNNQMQKAYDANSLVWELASNTIRAFFASGGTSYFPQYCIFLGDLKLVVW